MNWNGQFALIQFVSLTVRFGGGGPHIPCPRTSSYSTVVVARNSDDAYVSRVAIKSLKIALARVNKASESECDVIRWDVYFRWLPLPILFSLTNTRIYLRFFAWMVHHFRPWFAPSCYTTGYFHVPNMIIWINMSPVHTCCVHWIKRESRPKHPPLRYIFDPSICWWIKWYFGIWILSGEKSAWNTRDALVIIDYWCDNKYMGARNMRRPFRRACYWNGSVTHIQFHLHAPNQSPIHFKFITSLRKRLALGFCGRTLNW